MKPAEARQKLCHRDPASEGHGEQRDAAQCVPVLRPGRPRDPADLQLPAEMAAGEDRQAAERCPICSGHKGFFEGELWTPCVNCDGTGEKPCSDCAEMAKQRDHYREKSRANSSGQLAEELSCALARIERLELALEAWEETYSPCEHDPNYPSWCLTHHTKGCNVEEARRLTEEARK